MSQLRTEQFDVFYAQVEAALLNYAASRKLLSFRPLIDGFRREYVRWSHDSQYPLASGLAEINLADKLFRLIGFAYIHMAYDLPRVIAELLPGLVHNSDYDAVTPSDVKPEKITEATRLNDIWLGFMEADETLVQTFTEQILSSGVLGKWRWFAKWFARKPLQIAGLWVVIQRHEAWHNGEKLACSPRLENTSLLQASLCEQISSVISSSLSGLPKSATVFDAGPLLRQLKSPVLPSIANIPRPTPLKKEAGERLAYFFDPT